MRSLSVVIPAYNEERRLPGTVEAVGAFLPDAEIILVDDGSRDGTLQVMRTLERRIPGVRVLTYAPNRGKGYATRAGVLAATREAVLCCDADQSTPIADVERLWPWYDRGFDVVIASRNVRDSEIAVPQPAHRRGMGRVFNTLVSIFGVRGIRDTQCGFKLYRTDAARSLFEKMRTDGFAFDVEVLMRARRAGLRIAEVGVRWDDSADSRVSPLRDSLRMLLEVVRMRAVV